MRRRSTSGRDVFGDGELCISAQTKKAKEESNGVDSVIGSHSSQYTLSRFCLDASSTELEGGCYVLLNHTCYGVDCIGHVLLRTT